MEVLTTECMEDYLHEHHQFFHSGQTRDLPFRLQQLSKLKEAIITNEKRIIAALYQDLGKSEFEAYATEIGFALSSIGHTMKHLKKWMKPQKVKTPLHQFPSKSYIMKEPYGTVLIIGPYNYPFQLLIEPLIGAIATGNCVVLKPSENTPTVSTLIKEMIEEIFNKSYIRVIEGDKDTTSILIHTSFDYIFFTGSVAVGKIVMQAAAKNLVPVTLELGGKSPVIVDRTANIELAAKRIIWGKMMNTGQTCIAPDYVLAHVDIKQVLVDEMKSIMTNFYGSDAKLSKDYGRIVNERQFDRLINILTMDRANIIVGGNAVKDDLYIEPTLLATQGWSDAVMQDEIFGPILPIMEYRELDDIVNMINSRPKPLSLYVFTEDKIVEQGVLSRVSFGGGCINDTISHVANTNLPFGGVGSAGIGAYHGKYSFDTFSHAKSILKKSTKLDIKIVFPPYGDKVKWIRKLLK